MPDKVKPFIIEIYSDERMSDTYAAYASGTEDDIEEVIGTSEELISYLVDQYIGNWGFEDQFDDEEDYEEWEAMIGPHATEVTEEDINDPEYMKWFNTLEIIYDERNS